jgi:hypothetical protein
MLPSDFVGETLEAAMRGPSVEDPSQMGNLSHDTQRLIKLLQDDPAFDRSRLATIEFGFLPCLDRAYSQAGPATLFRAVNADAALFVALVRAAYRGKNDSLPDEISEQDRARAQRAHDVLEAIDFIPGNLECQRFEAPLFIAWLEKGEQDAAGTGHQSAFEYLVGCAVGRATRKFDDDTPQMIDLGAALQTAFAVRADWTRGFVNGIINSRGVTSRRPFEGGGQERDLAQRYRRIASLVRSNGPKLANAYTDLAEYYESLAQTEDEDAARDSLGR